jgi:hypothetical protein
VYEVRTSEAREVLDEDRARKVMLVRGRAMMVLLVRGRATKVLPRAKNDEEDERDDVKAGATARSQRADESRRARRGGRAQRADARGGAAPTRAEWPLRAFCTEMDGQGFGRRSCRDLFFNQFGRY